MRYPPLVLTLDVPTAEATPALLLAASVIVEVAVHPGLHSRMLAAGASCSQRTYTVRSVSALRECLAAIAPGCARVDGARTVAEVAEALGVPADVAALADPAVRRPRPARRQTVRVSARGPARAPRFTLEVLAGGLDLAGEELAANRPMLHTYAGAADLLAAVDERVVVDRSDGRFTQLRRLASTVAVARQTPGAPALADVFVGQAPDAVQMGARDALELLGRHDVHASVVCDPAVADAAALASAANSEPPAGLDPRLLDHQARFAVLYRECGAGLVCALPTGSGKTVAAAAAMALRGARRALVVCPVGVLSQWAVELAQFHPHAEVRVCSSAAEVAEAFESEPAVPFAVVAAHTAVVRAVAAGCVPAVDDLVVDEAAFLRNRSKRTSACWELRRVAGRAMALTATPESVAVDDVGAVAAFALGEPDLFVAAPLSAPGAPWPERLGPVLFGATEHIGVLPEAHHRVEVVPATHPEEHLVAVAQSCWRDARAAARAAAGTARAGRTKVAEMAAASMLRAAACDPSALGPSAPAQVRTAAGQVEERPRRRRLAGIAADGVPTLVFCESATLATDLAAWLTGQGTAAAALVGSDPPRRRRDVVAAFGAQYTVLVCGPVGRLGLNLQVARRVVHFDVPATTAHARQREGRARRIGGGTVEVVFLASSCDPNLRTAQLLAASGTSAPSGS